jgi:hypothetical protein
VIGDLNGDGRPDLATANYASCTVSVLLANGDGTFHVTELLIGHSPGSITIADVNRDGQPDLVTANQDNTVAVLLGNGDGTFDAESVYDGESAYGVASRSVTVGDLNGDGEPDLATASNNVSVLLGRGDGTFGPRMSVSATGEYPRFVRIGDLDENGAPDLMVSCRVALSVLLGNGDGSFRTRVDYPDDSALPIATGDLNGDDNLDLATGCPGLGTVSVLLGDGNGSFGSPIQYGAGMDPVSVAIGDLNGDGRPDLTTANRGPTFPIPEPGTVSVLLGNGDGSFGANRDYAAGYAPGSVALDDLDGNGRLDLAVANEGVSVLLGRGDGGFRAKVDYDVGGGYPGVVAIQDLNGDRRPDLVTVNGSSGTVSVLLNRGDGSFGTSREYPAGGGSSLAAGDLNGDGQPDLVVAHDYRVSVLLGNGDGTFGKKIDYGIGGDAQSVAIGDLDGDRKPDLALVIRNAGVTVLRNLGGNPECLRPFGPLVPANLDSLRTATPLLRWRSARWPGCAEPVRYRLFWSEDPGFHGADSVDVGPDTTYAFPPGILSTRVSYHWRVRVSDDQGRERGSDPVPAWSFYIKDNAAVLLEPSAAAREDGIIVTWAVARGEGFDGFRIYRRVDGSGWVCIEPKVPPESRRYVDTNIEPGARYEYEIEAYDASGSMGRFGPVSAEAMSPAVVSVRVRPNPVRGALEALLALPKGGDVLLHIYDPQGREIARRSLPAFRAGLRRESWDARDRAGHPLRSGTYYLRVDAPGGHATARWLLIR